jgi:hypothetical protein
MSFAKVINRIADPAPNVLPFLEQINGQLQIALAAAPKEQGNEYSTELGTLTASRRNSKPFIVGFIPPDNPVNFVPIARQLQKVGATGTGKAAPTGTAGAAGELLPIGELPNTSPEFQAGLIQIAQELGLDPNHLAAVIQFESRFNPAAKNPHSSGSGLIQFMGSTAKRLGTTVEEIRGMSREEQLPYVKAYFESLGGKGSNFLGRVGRGGDPLGDTYLCVLNPSQVGKSPGTVVWTAPAAGGPGADRQTGPLHPDGCSISNPKGEFCANRGLAGGGNTITVGQMSSSVKGIYNRGARGTPIQVSGPEAIVQTEEIVSEDRAIMAAGGFTGKESDLLGERIGRNIDIDSERLEIVAEQTDALRAQIDLIGSTPPLVMLINPSQFTRTHENAVDSSPKTRHGHVIHAWLERPMKIMCSGITAGQYAVDYEGAGGLTNVNRVHSISYGNLLSLVNIYRNNGIVYSGPEGDVGIPIVPFTIFIYYDNHVYLGSFDDFSVEDSSEKPHNMTYSFGFTVRYDQHLDLDLGFDQGVAASLQF